MSVTEEELCHHMKIVARVHPENTEEKEGRCHKVVLAVAQERDRDATHTTSLQPTIESSRQSKETSQEKQTKDIDWNVRSKFNSVHR
jgi:hypothetical protein